MSTEFIFPTPAGDGSSNTAAIAGGVVGGTLGLLAIILAIFFVLGQHRKRDRNDENLEPEPFDENAARPGAMPDMDLAGAKVVPFQFHPQVGQQEGYGQQEGHGQQGGYRQEGGYGQHQQMAQRPGMLPPAMVGGSGHGRPDAYSSTSESYRPSTVTDQSITGIQDAGLRGPSPGPSLGTSATHSSRDRESSVRRRLRVADTKDRGEGGSGQGGSGSGMIQHRNGGPLQEETVPEEVPPGYYSIPSG